MLFFSYSLTLTIEIEKNRISDQTTCDNESYDHKHVMLHFATAKLHKHTHNIYNIHIAIDINRLFAYVSSIVVFDDKILNENDRKWKCEAFFMPFAFPRYRTH
jgi:hypothetical protein